MIKGKESDVGNLDFEFWVTGLERWQILMFYTVFELQIIVHISATRCPTEMGFGSKCSILNGQVIYIKKSKLNIADMWLIPLDHAIPLDRVTYAKARRWILTKSPCCEGIQLWSLVYQTRVTLSRSVLLPCMLRCCLYWTWGLWDSQRKLIHEIKSEWLWKVCIKSKHCRFGKKKYRYLQKSHCLKLAKKFNLLHRIRHDIFPFLFLNACDQFEHNLISNFCPFVWHFLLNFVLNYFSQNQNIMPSKVAIMCTTYLSDLWPLTCRLMSNISFCNCFDFFYQFVLFCFCFSVKFKQ